MKKNIEYFPEFVNDIYDQKIEILISQYGFEGLGRYHFLLELIGQQEGCILAIKKNDSKLWLMTKLGFKNKKELEDFLNFLDEINLIIKTDCAITSNRVFESFIKTMGYRVKEREKKRRQKEKIENNYNNTKFPRENEHSNTYSNSNSNSNSKLSISSTASQYNLPEKFNFLLREPYNFNVETINHLIELEKSSSNNLIEVALWYKENYADKGKEGNAFALISTALNENYDIKEDKYYEWGSKQAGYDL